MNATPRPSNEQSDSRPLTADQQPANELQARLDMLTPKATSMFGVSQNLSDVERQMMAVLVESIAYAGLLNPSAIDEPGSGDLINKIAELYGSGISIRTFKTNVSTENITAERAQNEETIENLPYIDTESIKYASQGIAISGDNSNMLVMIIPVELQGPDFFSTVSDGGIQNIPLYSGLRLPCVVRIINKQDKSIISSRLVARGSRSSEQEKTQVNIRVSDLSKPFADKVYSVGNLVVTQSAQSSSQKSLPELAFHPSFNLQ